MRYWMIVGVLLGMAGSVLAQGLSIAHDAVPFGVRGQPLTLKAKVTGGEPVESVTLYYALFRDAAPFRVPMKATGLGYYVGTIEASVVASVDSFSYYIEAQDQSGAITESPWYEVPLRKAETKAEAPVAGLPMPRPAGPAAPAPVTPVSNEKPVEPSSDGSWKTPALIAGGAAIVLGGAYAISQSSGGGGDDQDDGGDEPPPVDPQGTYNGNVTTCITTTGGVTTCESGAMSIVVGANKVVFSETIKPGEQLTDGLSGNSFTLVSSTSELGVNRTINYEGTIVENKIIGSVGGSASDGSTYSGTFSANKQ